MFIREKKIILIIFLFKYFFLLRFLRSGSYRFQYILKNGISTIPLRFLRSGGHSDGRERQSSPVEQGGVEWGGGGGGGPGGRPGHSHC